jgi:predicted acylesterase/phospholipase RssA
MLPPARFLPILAVLFAGSLGAAARAQGAPPDTVAAPADTVSAPGQEAPTDSIPVPPYVPPAPPDSVEQKAVPDTVAAPPRPRSWALVLSGGAARGIAHIGVIRALEEEGIRPGLVCGTSMGALIGALYSTGYSSSQIRDMVRHTDWDQIFGRERETFEWRDTVVPEPWLALIGEGLQLHLPSGVVDDSYLNYMLATYYLPSEAIAQGDFDRLPIPFRCVGTDAETSNLVVFRSGSVAKAVRTSISIPPLFPAVPDGQTLLVDGGLASNLPVSTARASAADHILAIEVSLPPVDLNDRSSMLQVSWSIFDRVNKCSQQDTLSSRDRLVWLHLPRYGPMDFAACDSLIELGYREAKEQVHEFAELVRADSGVAHHDRVPVQLPPARPEVVWLDRAGQPSPRADVARRLFGDAPDVAFEPDTLRKAFEDVYRGDMFVSTWPTFAVTDDSTTISVIAESRPASEMLIAFGYDNDIRARVNGTLVLRPLHRRLPDKISLGATYDPQRINLFFALEPHSLARGSDGWFLRGGWRQTDVRLFDEHRDIEETRIERLEAAAGYQKRLMRGYLLQAGGGYGFAGGDITDLTGVLASVRIQSGSPFGPGIQTVLFAGTETYATVIARATTDVRLGPIVVRTSARAGSSSKHTPPDELQALGGPESFAGLRRREWLGQDRLAGELRVLHSVTSSMRVFAYGQAGTITQSVSRPDFNGEVHVAVGAGVEAQVPFGPLNLDWGISDDGEFRLDFNFGQRF